MLEFLIIVIAFLGLVFGILLSKHVKDEIIDGKKYLHWFEVLILIILSISLFYYSFNLIGFISFFIGIIISFLLKRVYFYLGLALFLSFLINVNYLALIASLVLIYGLFYGSLNGVKVKNKVNFLIFELILFLVPFLLFFVKDFVVDNIFYFLGFTAGALLLKKRK